jgi:hypothetical protein
MFNSAALGRVPVVIRDSRVSKALTMRELLGLAARKPPKYSILSFLSVSVFSVYSE